MNLATRKYEDADMDKIREDPFQEEVKNYPDLVVPDNSYTCVFDNEIVAVGGIKVMEDNVGEAWVIMTGRSKKNGIFGLIACRTIKDKLERLIDELNIEQCIARVRANFPIAMRFTEALGFKLVKILPKWFPNGTDALLYKR